MRSVAKMLGPLEIGILDVFTSLSRAKFDSQTGGFNVARTKASKTGAPEVAFRKAKKIKPRRGAAT